MNRVGRLPVVDQGEEPDHVKSSERRCGINRWQSEPAVSIHYQAFRLHGDEQSQSNLC